MRAKKIRQARLDAQAAMTAKAKSCKTTEIDELRAAIEAAVLAGVGHSVAGVAALAAANDRMEKLKQAAEQREALHRHLHTAMSLDDLDAFRLALADAQKRAGGAGGIELWSEEQVAEWNKMIEHANQHKSALEEERKIRDEEAKRLAELAAAEREEEEKRMEAERMLRMSNVMHDNERFDAEMAAEKKVCAPAVLPCSLVGSSPPPPLVAPILHHISAPPSSLLPPLLCAPSSLRPPLLCAPLFST